LGKGSLKCVNILSSNLLEANITNTGGRGLVIGLAVSVLSSVWVGIFSVCVVKSPELEAG